MDRLDNYDDMPREMRSYLRAYGWHFSKALCEDAVSKMKGRDGKPLQALGKDEVNAMLKQYNVELKNDVAYDVSGSIRLWKNSRLV